LFKTLNVLIAKHIINTEKCM